MTTSVDDSNPIVMTKHRYVRGDIEYFPNHDKNKSWCFGKDKDEAILATAVMTVAENNGLSVNDVQHIFPAILRMLKSKSIWAE